MSQLNNSQSAAAVNSANVVVRYIDVRPKGGNYKWQIEKINAINEFFNAEFFSDDFESARVESIVNSKEVFPRLYMGDVRLQPKNNKPFMAKNSGAGMFKEMNDMVTTMAVIYDMLECDFYPFPAVKYEWKEDFLKERGLEVYMSIFDEAPELEEAPALEEAPMLEEDDDITEEGYSVEGIAYVKENTSEVSMADIIRAVSEEHWNFESVVKESQWTRFTNDSFRDLIWSTCWAEYLVGHTDEALEAETRYVLDFDSVYDDLFDELWPYMSTYDDSCGGCELWVNAWDVVERAAEIIEESGARCIDWDNFPNYVMDAFLGNLYGFDTFTERVMSELEGGDIVDILPYDDGLHLSFVDDEAEVAA